MPSIDDLHNILFSARASTRKLDGRDFMTYGSDDRRRAHILYQVFEKVWLSGDMPFDVLDRTGVLIPKLSRDSVKALPEETRPITLNVSRRFFFSRTVYQRFCSAPPGIPFY